MKSCAFTVESPSLLKMRAGEWSKTSAVAAAFTKEMAKALPLGRADELEKRLLAVRAAHGTELVRRFKDDFPLVDIESFWAEIERSRQEVASLVKLGDRTVSRFIDATAWGYTRDGTYQQGRFMVKRLAKCLAMTQEAVRERIGRVKTQVECPSCGKEANVWSPCAPLSSYEYPTQIECGACGHVDTLARAPMVSYADDPRAFGGRLTCRCARCEQDRLLIGARAAQAIIAAIDSDVEMLRALAGSKDWMELYEQGSLLDHPSKWDPVLPGETSGLERMIEVVKRRGGVATLDAQSMRDCFDEAAGLVYVGLGRCSEASRLFARQGVGKGWLALVGCRTPVWHEGGRRLVLDVLAQSMSVSFAGDRSGRAIGTLIEALSKGDGEAFRRMVRMTYCGFEVGAPVVADVVFDPERVELRRIRVSLSAEREDADGAPPRNGFDGEGSEGIPRANASTAAREGMDAPEANVRSARVQAERSDSATSQLMATSRNDGSVAIRPSSSKGMGWKAHLASHERLLVQLKRRLEEVVHEQVRQGKAAMEEVLINTSAAQFAERMARATGLSESDIVRAIADQAAALADQRVKRLVETRLHFGKNLMETKASSGLVKREVLIIRADFELDFRAFSYVVTLDGRMGSAAQSLADVARVVKIEGSEHRFKVVGCVFGKGVRVGQAVDEMGDVLLAAKAHYDVDRKVAEGMYESTHHCGRVMFVTDDENIFDVLIDQYDGVLLSNGGTMLGCDFEHIQSALKVVVRVT